MRYRESGMPPEEMWETFFNPKEVLDKMSVNTSINTLIDIGCGYGTFLSAAVQVSKKVIGIDIDDKMIKACTTKIQEQHLENVHLIHGDITDCEVVKKLEANGGKIDYVSLFNILHCEQPVLLLKSVYHLLDEKGKIGVIHWNYDKTPRGPSMAIRPKPEDIINWSMKAGFILEKQMELPPYHYGLVFIKNECKI